MQEAVHATPELDEELLDDEPEDDELLEDEELLLDEVLPEDELDELEDDSIRVGPQSAGEQLPLLETFVQHCGVDVPRQLGVIIWSAQNGA